MTGHNSISDKNINNLFKWRLLEQDVDDDLLTQKLIDMEAKLVFSNEALLLPSLQKEKELFKKLNAVKKSNKNFTWLLSIILISILTTLLVLYKDSKMEVVSVQKNDKINSVQKFPKQPVVVNSEPISVESIMHAKTFDPNETDNSLIVVDTSKENVPEKWMVGDPGIKVNYKQEKEKYDPSYYEAYDNIPVLNEKQIDANNKLKDKMIKQLMKRDKSIWTYIPMGSDIFYSDTFSLQAFYISSTEVTNRQYRVFLNDLIIHDKTDDYIKAAPDTTKWRLDPKKNYEPMVNMYFWHPAYNDFPMVNVSREQAQHYCIWLTEQVNQKIKENNPEKGLASLYINDLRIPDETEWMWAARGGNLGVEYPWSTAIERKSIQNSKGCFLCNFSILNYPDSLVKLSQCTNAKLKEAITSAGSVSGDCFFTAKVSSYNPNDYGVYCIAGNVAEMVWKKGTNAPVTKGGSWNSDAEHVKISARENEGIVGASPYIGFRPVFTAVNQNK